MLVHTVFFWLRPDLSDAQRDAFRLELATLGRICAPEAFYMGRPAPVPARPVVDQSFDWSITCLFAGPAEHDAYQAHPDHVAFVERCRALWSRVVVYDAA